MSSRVPLIAGNWKMNGLKASLQEIKTLGEAFASSASDILICPPATLLAVAVEAASSTAVTIGAQAVRPEAKGAFTGDIAADMVAELGARFAITGHSERREFHGETSAYVADTATAIQRAGMTAIVCVGESLDLRKDGDAERFIADQLRDSIPSNIDIARLVIAYEPIWAIGTGEAASPADIDQMHQAMRASLVERFGDAAAQSIRLLYGGSVKASNADDILSLSDVDGALVGGASLTAKDFGGIIEASNRLL